MGRKAQTKANGAAKKGSTPAPAETAAPTIIEKSTPQKDNLVKSLSSLPEGADPVAFILEKFEKLELDNAKLADSNAELSAKVKRIPLYEKKITQAELLLSKCEIAKGRMEDLCRELQKQNRDIKIESIEKIQIMEKNRDEIVTQFKTSLKEIQDSVDNGRQSHTRLFDENKALMERIAAITENYELKFQLLSEEFAAKEKLNENVVTTKEMEKKLLTAKLDAENIMRQKLEQEKNQLELLLTDLEQRLKTSLEAEKTLRTQLLEYGDRYGELTKSLNNSNDAFDKFKKQMEKMNGNLIKVERESRKWKQKFDQASQNVLVLAMEKKEIEGLVEKKNKQLELLQQLCRRLRNEGPESEQPSASEEAKPEQETTSST